MKNFHHVFIFMTLAAVLAGAPARAKAEDMATKYTLIAAYIYNFAQHTTWPNGNGEAFNVCLLGADPFGSILEPMKSRKVNDTRISIRHYSSPGSDLPACNVLYVDSSEKRNLKEIFSTIHGAPVLTMSDMAGFSNAGGMVEFGLKGGRIGVEVALSEVRVKGLSISPQLLSIESMTIR